MQNEFTVTKKQVAYMLGVDERTITQYQKESVHPLPIKAKGKRGVPHEYCPYAIVNWKVAKEVNNLVRDSDGIVIDGEAEKARLTKEQADSVAIKNEEARRNLLPMWLLEWTIEDMASQIAPILDAVESEIKKKDRDISNRALKVIAIALAKGRNIAKRTKPNYSKLDTADK